MSPTIPESVVREVLSRTSVVQLVGEFVALKKAGARHKGLCPFHHEKSPSFTVNEELGFFHCFGCGESGDGISFLRKHNGLSFVEAVEQLAARAGVRIEREEDPAAARRSRALRDRERTVQEEQRRICEAASEWFHERLMQAPRDSVVRTYLTERGLTEDTVATFRLGYAPSEWGALTDWLTARRMPLDKAQAAGLVAPRKSGSGHYDRFRNRLIFPIHDLTERVIAFGGRILPGEDDEAAKYVNSPDSLIYTKGDVLFGLAQAKKYIRTEGEAILVEGNIDLLMLHQMGLKNVVAPMGTALTVKQVHLLRRFTERVVLLYDGDGAGRKAARAGLPLLLEAGASGRVAMLPQGEDPDSFVRKNGADALRELVARAAPLAEYLIAETVKEHGTSAHGQARAIEELAPVIARVHNPRERDLLVAQIASALRLDERRVAGMLTDPRLAQREAQAAKVVRVPKMPLRERKLVEVALWYPVILRVIEHEDRDTDLVAHTGLRDVLWEAITIHGEDGTLGVTRLLEALADHPLATWVADVVCRDPDVAEDAAEAFVRDAIRLLRQDRMDERVRSIEHEIGEAQRNGDEARVMALLREKLELRQELQRARTAER